MTVDSNLKYCHNLLFNIIVSFSNDNNEKKDNTYKLILSNGWIFVADKKDKSIYLSVSNKTYFIGKDYNGFFPDFSEVAYKNLIGVIAKCFWRSRQSFFCNFK